MASFRIRTRRDGSSYTAVLWREDGKQTSLSFDDHKKAMGFKALLEQSGPEKAREVYDAMKPVPEGHTLHTWCSEYIDGLTGIEEATRNRYRSYLTRDLATISATPLFAVDERAIAGWVNSLDGSGKTIANKHGFLAGALKVAVRRGHMASNPCDHTRLPAHDREEMCFLTAAEFGALRDAMTERWRPLTTFLVTTGCRFSEATALQPRDVDLTAGTIRITRAWKYTGQTAAKLGGPKSKKGRRTINVPPQAIEALGDLTALARDAFIFTTERGTPIRSQLYHNKAWRPALLKADLGGKTPRPHDLRHTCASWLIQAGVPLPVIQQHMGHESITTTIGTYGHLDRTSNQAASAAIGAALSGL
ncbi:site-specific integrase [Rhodococcoides fascians]|uniref:tyrosine-type recombinase/integrase n=1 Tax=Rhodococcoides fascians TaxID=1828 RepID=UPI002ACE66CF|nr:site-specific integrase [Rhodococcus fascians]WQH26570.1 site-specific integrase [Rhodococcus fascians]